VPTDVFIIISVVVIGRGCNRAGGGSILFMLPGLGAATGAKQVLKYCYKIGGILCILSL